MKKSYKCVLWDWNGTLVDDVIPSLYAVNQILTDRGMQPITLSRYHSYIDTPIVRFYEHFFDLGSTDFSVIAYEFKSNYKRFMESGGLFANTVPVLSRLRSLGVRQYIVSAERQETITGYLDKYGIAAYFSGVCGACTDFAESKTERGKRFFAGIGESPSDCLFVGDTLHDYEVAGAIGTDCAIIARGHQSMRELEPVADICLSDISDILGFFTDNNN